jgi:hypothetical protein
LCAANGLAKIGFGVQTVFTFAALGRVQRNNVIAFFQGFHPGAYVHYNTRTFMAENRRKLTFRIIAGKRKGISVANTGRFYFDQNLTSFWSFEVNVNNFQRFSGGKGHRCTSFHHHSPTSATRHGPQVAKTERITDGIRKCGLIYRRKCALRIFPGRSYP